MGFSMLGFIVWISLLLAINSFSVHAQLITTTLHSTHPQVAYAPESCCMKDIFKRCRRRYDPFTMSTYVDPNSMKRTFFQTSSWGNEPHSSNMKRRVEVSFYGRAVYVYGPPRAQLDNRPGRIEISLNGQVMETVDLESKYREANDEPWNPLLMYHWEGGGGDAAHNLQITLLDAALGTWRWHPIRGFGLESVVYTSLEPWRPPKYSLSEFEKLVDVTIHDTNFVTSFTPSYAWQKEESAVVSSQGIRSFHRTSNELAFNSQNIAKFAAQCAALAVYGASPAQLAATFAGGFRHGHLQICQGRNCEFIDAHQAYLNVPDHLWNEPVLLYNTDRMPPGSSTAVTMRLLDPPSPVGHLWTMTLSHAVCSQVMPKWSWTHPIPDGNYSSHVVGYHRLDYAPSFLFGLSSPWMNWMGLYSIAAAEPPWFFGLLGNLPSWSTTVQGHEIKIFIPFPTLYPASRYANVRCCIDGWCHYPDTEQWYLKARDSQSNIPLVHYQDLNPFRRHRISVTAVRRKDEVGDKVIAVSQVEYQQVLVAHQPSPTPPIPSMPTQGEPFDDDGDLALGFAAVVIIFIVFKVWWCLVVILADAQGQGSEREPLLPAPGSRPRLQPQPQLVINWSSSFSSETGRMSEEFYVDSPTGPLGVARNPQHGPRFTSSDRDDAKLNLSPKTDRLRSKSIVDSSPGLPPDPPGSRTGTRGLSNGWGNSNPRSSSDTSRYDECPTSRLAAWIKNPAYGHHHHQRPLFPSGTDRGFRAFTPNDYQSWNGHPLPDGAHSRYQQLAYSTNPWPSESSSQLSTDALSLAIGDVRPFPPTSTDSDILSQSFDRIAPPSYDACVSSGTVITIPPRPHAPIIVPAPPPPRRAEPAARLNPIPERTDGYRRTGGRVQDDQQPRPLRQTTEGFAGRGTGRSRHRLQPWSQLVAETASPSLAAAENTSSGGGTERGQERSSARRSSRRRGEGGGTPVES